LYKYKKRLGGYILSIEKLKKLKRNLENTKKALLSLENILEQIHSKNRDDNDYETPILKTSAILRDEKILDFV